jgi:hypothetical protein
VSRWQIQIPHRDRSDSLTDVVEAARELAPDDDRVLRQIVRDELVGGSAATAGELLDKLEAATPAERRRLLDTARAKVGLPTTDDVEATERYEAANAAGRIRAAKQSTLQLCGAEGCSVAPTNAAGAVVPVGVKRWWCAEHEHLAAPGDLDPRPGALRMTDAGTLIEIDPDEEERERAAAQSRQAALKAQAADRQAEAEAARVNREAREAELDRLLPPGVPG